MTTKIPTIIGVVYLLLQLAACQSSDPNLPQSPASLEQDLALVRATYGPDALSYLEAALDTLKRHHVVGPDHDWEELRLATLEQAEGAQSPSDTYDAIRFALQDLDERHGYLMPPAPEEEAPASSETDAHDIEPQVQLGKEIRPALELRHDVGMLRIPSFAGISEQESSAYATHVQRQIEKADAAGVCGWIIDLRGNGGGNMWAMIAGLGPLLGEGQVGAFVDRRGQQSRWYYEGGRALLDTTVLAAIKAEAYRLRDNDSPVAVLTDDRTGSSGEAVALGFVGRRHTRSFGEPTGGASTVPGYFELSDGAWLVFSTERMADRSGKSYGGRVMPDEETPRPEDAARAWLRSEYGCPSR